MLLHFTRVPGIIFIIPVKSRENWLLGEFLQSSHRHNLLSNAAFWKTEACSRTPMMPPPPPHVDRKLVRWAQPPSPHIERPRGWCTCVQVAQDIGPRGGKGRGKSSGCSFDVSLCFHWVQTCAAPIPTSLSFLTCLFLLPSYCPQDNWQWHLRGDEVNPTRARTEWGCPTKQSSTVQSSIPVRD